MTLFTVDVKALYPSVKLEYVKKFPETRFGSRCTDWTEPIKCTLIELIHYTLSNQQILWEGKYYTLSQGITTGRKHSVPLANILLSYLFHH